MALLTAKALQAIEPYSYTRLKKPDGQLQELRFLTLYCGDFDDEIHVAIARRQLDFSDLSHSLEVKTDFEWFALSYTWGDAADPSRVTVVSDNHRESHIPVSQNLDQALRHIRCRQKNQLLWVDAICMDQGQYPEALEERAWQVRVMHHIYAQATGVIIWLGREADDSTYAIESMRTLGSSFSVDWISDRISTRTGELSGEMRYWNNGRASSNVRQAVANLLQRPWWDRVWIRQEIFFASEGTSRVLCGHSALPLADLRKAIYFITTIGLNSPRENERLSLALSVCLRKASDEPNLLRRIRSSNCVDPRDRVYGLLGILESTSGAARRAVPVKIDYDMSNTADDVYRDLALRYVDRYGTLRLLEESGLWQGTEMRPTWVPDWRAKAMHQQMDLSLEVATSHFVKAECEYLGSGILRVLGCCTGRVSKLHMLGPVLNEQHSWREIAIMMLDELYSLEGQITIERISRALTSVMYQTNAELHVLQGDREDFKNYMTYLYSEAPKLKEDISRVPKLPLELVSGRAAKILAHCVQCLGARGAPLIFLANGYVGPGPTNVMPGDEVWAIIGSRALMILRKVSDGKRYEVVGPCYIHGFNWGEALLGPLPEQYTIVPLLDRDQGAYVPHYVNTTTGKASMWDPRITWEELEPHPPMVNFQYVKAPPDEPLRVRPDSKYLRRHKIDIHYVDLV